MNNNFERDYVSALSLYVELLEARAKFERALEVLKNGEGAFVFAKAAVSALTSFEVIRRNIIYVEDDDRLFIVTEKLSGIVCLLLKVKENLSFKAGILYLVAYYYRNNSGRELSSLLAETRKGEKHYSEKMFNMLEARLS